MENVENLSTISVDKSEIAACFVESVEKLSPNNVDNPYFTVWLVDNVDNLFTDSLDKSEIATCFVESVEKLSTFVVDKWKQGKKRKNHQVIHIYCG